MNFASNILIGFWKSQYFICKHSLKYNGQPPKLNKISYYIYLENHVVYDLGKFVNSRYSLYTRQQWMETNPSPHSFDSRKKDDPRRHLNNGKSSWSKLFILTIRIVHRMSPSCWKGTVAEWLGVRYRKMELFTIFRRIELYSLVRLRATTHANPESLPVIAYIDPALLPHDCSWLFHPKSYLDRFRSDFTLRYNIPASLNQVEYNIGLN